MSEVLPGASDASEILKAEVLQEINFGLYLAQRCWHTALQDARNTSSSEFDSGMD